MSRWIEFVFGVRVVAEHSHSVLCGNGSIYGKGDVCISRMLDLGPVAASWVNFNCRLTQHRRRDDALLLR